LRYVNFSDLIDQFTDMPQQTKLPLISADQPNFPKFLKPSLKLKEGQISDPVDSPFGYLIFRRVSMEVVTASHILIAHKDAQRTTSKRDRKEAIKLAEQILKELKSGKDFAELARQHSDGPSGPKGGDLASFTRGQMVPEFDEAVFKLKQGTVSDIVETQFG
jgi:parvulin-like peptidyl-prolyl isomerase